MFVTNTFEYDSRVLKEARTLTRAGYEVTVVAIGGPGLPARESCDGVRVARIDAEPPQAKLRRALQRRRIPQAANETKAPAAEDAAEIRPRPSLPPAVSRAVDTVAGKAHRVARWWRFALGALRLAREEPADIYVAHDLNTLPIAERASRRDGARLVYDSHEVYVELPGLSRLARRRWLEIERRLLPRVDRMFMSSPGHVALFTRHHRVPPPPVIINAPPRSMAPAAEEVPDLRAELALPPELPIVLYMGGVFPLRRLESLVELATAVERCAVVIMGPGFDRYVKDLRALAAKRGVADRVRLPAPVPPEDVVRYAAAADLGVIPLPTISLNTSNALPNKLLEYLMAGIPVVGSAFPQITEIVERFDVGATYDPDVPGELEVSVRALLADGRRHAELRRNARAAAEELNWDREAKKLLTLFDSVAPNR